MPDNIANIKFDDGSKKVLLNGDPNREFRWYPSDPNFVDRFLAFQAYAETIPDKLSAIRGLEGATLDDDGVPTGDLGDYEPGSFERLGAEFNAEFDKAFGSPVSAAAFGVVNPLAPTPGGGLRYENFLDAIVPHIEKSFEGFEESRKKYTEGFKNRAARRSANGKRSK